MIYEIRHYTLFDGKYDDMIARFRSLNLPLFEKYDIKFVQTWSHPDDSNMFSFLMSFRDSDARTQAWQRYHEDETFIAGKEVQATIIKKIEWHVLSEVDIGKP